MTALSLGLLGPFTAALDGRPVSSLTSNRLRALLAYLVVEADRDHLRQTLADLFYPESAASEASSRLRYALSNLRTAIGDREAEPPFLNITRETIQFNGASHYWLDVEVFESLASEENSGLLAQAVTLYRGPFLEGVIVEGSNPFEEWAVRRREYYEHRVLSLLQRLALRSEHQGEYARALDYSRRQLDIDRWLESAHRQVMRALALSGQRGAALVQFHACQQVLARELLADPEEETVALYDRIRLGQLSDMHGDGHFALGERFQQPNSVVFRSPFADRRDELAELEDHLDAVREGRGRAVFVVGGPGSGKTALLNELASRTVANNEDFLVAAGGCSPFVTSEDFCLPVCQILNQLLGNPEFTCSEFSFGNRDSERSSELLATMIRYLAELGPGLVDVYVPAEFLASALDNVDQWPAGHGSREEWVGKFLADRATVASAHFEPGFFDPARQIRPGRWSASIRASQLEQLIRVITALAHHRPLLLLLDNLQWSDSITLRFLTDFGSRLAACQILLVGAYRNDELAIEDHELALSQDHGPSLHVHPLALAVIELQRRYGDILLDLDTSDAREFVSEFLRLTPNCFGEAFVDRFVQQTAGNPLMVCETWKDFVARKSLVRDAAGRWAEGPRLDWDRIPVRARAAMEEVVVSLPECWQEMLSIGSVQGDQFCAEVIALAQQVRVESVIRALSGPLSHEHRIVEPVTVSHMHARNKEAGPCLSMYRFRHHLFQAYIYQTLDQIRRMRLHESIGHALETLYHDSAPEFARLAPQLADHFEQAGMPGRAALYRKSPDRFPSAR